MATNIKRTLIPGTDGAIYNFTASGAVSSGDVVVIGDVIAIATKDVADTEEGQAKRGVRVTLPKLTTDVVTRGDLLYWDATPGELTLTSTSNTRAGTAAEDAGNGVTSMDVNLLP